MAALSVSMNHVTATIIFFVFLAQVTVMVNVCFANGDQSNILCHETEKQALLSFKRDLVDDFNKLVSWDVSKEEDCCKWAGISCNTQTGHVSELSLNNGSFTGKINPSLLNLTHLLSLDLSLNNFSQIIPNFMGSLVSLRYLNFTWGGFKGKIPHQLGNLSSLHYLVLDDSIHYHQSGWSWNDLYVENLHWVSGLSSCNTQLQSMNASSFIGNKLCGPPLLKKCREDHETVHQDASTVDGERQDDEYWFRLGIGMGFGVSFVGVIGPLLVCGFWRRAYFWFFEEYLWYKFVDYFIKVKYMF